jgi:hypothetical protein
MSTASLSRFLRGGATREKALFITSRWRGPRTGPPPPEGVHVYYPPAMAAAGQAHGPLPCWRRLYGWFTEGFEPADLQEAHALLEEWGE